MPQGQDKGGPIPRGIIRTPMGQMGPHHFGGEQSDPMSNEHYMGGNQAHRERKAADGAHEGKTQGMGDRQQGKGGSPAGGFGPPPGSSFNPGSHVGESHPTKGGAGQNKKNY